MLKIILSEHIYTFKNTFDKHHFFSGNISRLSFNKNMKIYFEKTPTLNLSRFFFIIKLKLLFKKKSYKSI